MSFSLYYTLFIFDWQPKHIYVLVACFEHIFNNITNNFQLALAVIFVLVDLEFQVQQNTIDEDISQFGSSSQTKYKFSSKFVVIDTISRMHRTSFKLTFHYIFCFDMLVFFQMFYKLFLLFFSVQDFADIFARNHFVMETAVCGVRKLAIELTVLLNFPDLD